MNMISSKIDANKLLLIGTNEVNFEFVQRYTKRGLLPTFAKLISQHGVQITTSETEYEHLEPWIQWVTAQTGKTFSEHGVYRLGDIIHHNHKQIWEHLESHGLKVGAISPMNAANRTQDAAFFLPDPWTATPATGGRLLVNLSKVVHDVVNDNATGRITPLSIFWLFASALRYVPLAKYRWYVKFLRGVVCQQKWAKAQILDELLLDVLKGEMLKHDPDFGTLFLNAAAHIQHHYMFNSSAYQGSQKNPDWLISADADPVLDVYNQYDRLLSELLAKFPEHRLIIATGLHQDPYPKEIFYWRLIAHDRFLRMIGVVFESVQPLMSRDFLVHFGSVELAKAAAAILTCARSDSGIALFQVDNRGKSLFVMLTFPHDIPPGMVFKVGSDRYEDLRNEVAFVAIKNGEHNGEGYLIDTALTASEISKIPLTYLPRIISQNFGIEWSE